MQIDISKLALLHGVSYFSPPKVNRKVIQAQDVHTPTTRTTLALLSRKPYPDIESSTMMAPINKYCIPQGVLLVVSLFYTFAIHTLTILSHHIPHTINRQDVVGVLRSIGPAGQGPDGLCGFEDFSVRNERALQRQIQRCL